MSEDTFDVPAEARPRHIAVIMDGNGRWAEARGLDRIEGHRAGTDAARRTIEWCGRLGIEALTLYSFSTENWNRPPAEVAALMSLVQEMLPGEHDGMMENSVRFRAIGDRSGLPGPVVSAIEDAEQLTSHNDRLLLNIALNYGSRQEILHAAQTLAARVAAGELAAEDIDEAAFSDALWTRDLPDPDLLIRTSGELRVSNFLLWQISYAEIVVTDTLWPDFGGEALQDAIRSYAGRSRRFGARP